jgi:RNA polymerase sigma factor (sigma-70 family)
MSGMNRQITDLKLRDKMVNDNVDLAYDLANRNFNQYVGPGDGQEWLREEFASESLLHLIKAANSYEEGMGANFSTYATACINNGMINFMRNEAASGMTPRFNCDDEPRPSKASPPYFDVIEGEDSLFTGHVELPENFMSLLPEKWRDVVKMIYIDGMSFGKVAQITGKSHQGVRHIMQKAIKRLRKEIERNL